MHPSNIRDIYHEKTVSINGVDIVVMGAILSDHHKPISDQVVVTNLFAQLLKTTDTGTHTLDNLKVIKH